MKKLILSLLLLCLFVSGFAQTDTLFTKSKEKIVCKILEINEFEVKYKQAASPDGPVYVVNKSTILKYTLSNGFSEMFLPDELSLENEHGDIIKNRTVIKIHPFSAVNNQISFAYEQVIKVGMNLDLEAGYVNNAINGSNSLGLNRLYSTTGKAAHYSGAYMKPGVKFFLGEDFSIKGLRYAHPLKGRYIKLDVALSYLNFQNVQRYQYIPNSYTVTMVSTDINTFAYGGFVNYGRQFILGNTLTIEYYVGLGFTGRSISYTNNNYTKNPGNPYYNYSEENAISNYHGFVRVPNFGMSFTSGFRIGYILPDNKHGKMPGAK